MAQISPKGIALIRRFESCRLGTYDDGTGIWTVGWGHTGSVDGVPVAPGMSITQEKADALLSDDLERFEAGVQAMLGQPASQDQFDALVSLAYNAGLAGLRGSNTLREFNAGNVSAAAEAFVHIIHVPTGISEGLVRRRAAEIVRFMGG